MQTHLDGGFQEIARLLRPPEPVGRAATRPAGDRRLGAGDRRAGLAANANLAFQRQQLVTGVLDGDAGACSLAGQLWSSSRPRPSGCRSCSRTSARPTIAGSPRPAPASSPMEEALVAWLRQCCDLAGISNTIELVHPGERFDAAAQRRLAGRGYHRRSRLDRAAGQRQGHMKAAVDVR